MAVLRQAFDGTRRGAGATASAARALLDPGTGVAPEVMASVLSDIGPQLLGYAIGRGWTPADLGQLTRRRLSPRHVGLLAWLLAEELANHPAETVAPRWLAELDALGPPEAVDVTTVAGVTVLLGLCVAIELVPKLTRVMAPPGAQRQRSGPAATRDPKDVQRLAKVRALLAKAESTEFAEEAEVLSAKAQELISRYALERLLDDPQTHHGSAPEDGVLVRRIWIDPPYVSAKCLLVQHVAEANRGRAVFSADLGFSTVFGVDSDLEPVELMVTSLLVQASAAMLHHGSQVSRHGTSQTASFRRAFLLSYAQRIGERLREATEHATEATGRAGELVPVLADREARVDAAREHHFPNTTFKGTRVSNAHGWVAGRAAADLARLDTRPLVEDG